MAVFDIVRVAMSFNLFGKKFSFQLKIKEYWDPRNPIHGLYNLLKRIRWILVKHGENILERILPFLGFCN